MLCVHSSKCSFGCVSGENEIEKTGDCRRRAIECSTGDQSQIEEEAYPDAQCALHHSSAFELLIATILSAQCTDERVNIVTADLFRKYSRCEDYLRVTASELEDDIRSTGFFRNKTRSIQGACQMLIEKYGGRVPETLEELIELPGVARKTANVVLGSWFGITSGVVVDTHVSRLSQRLGLTKETQPEKIEADTDETPAKEGMDWFFTPPDHAWPKNMHGTQASLSGLCRRTALSIVVIEDREEKPSLTLIEIV